MAQLRAFQAVRPQVDLAPQVASVPYDVVTTEEARQLAHGNPWSFLRVVRAEIELPAETDPASPRVYERAASCYRRFLKSGILTRDLEPALYLYELRLRDHVQTGVVGCCAVDEYDSGLIKKHERTRPEKENDRVQHALAVGAQTGPVFLTYRDHARVRDLVTGWKSRLDPLYAFQAEDGVGHRIWRIPTGGGLDEAFRQVPALYVADGHHRSASASRVRQALRQGNPGHRGSEEYNFFLAVLFPASEVQILPYNRVVLDLGELSTAGLLDQVSSLFQVERWHGPDPAPHKKGRFGMYLDGQWYQLEVPAELLSTKDPVARLDAAILQNQVLGPILGIDDPRTSGRIQFVGGSRGTEELARRVDGGQGSVSFALFPLGIEELLTVADRDQVLPPKSTWFEPKLRSGLLIHELE